jgi:hypothetical protein
MAFSQIPTFRRPERPGTWSYNFSKETLASSEVVTEVVEAENMAMRVPAATMPAAGRDVFGHPRGLIYVGGTELWERIPFHGMQALLYMVEAYGS